MLDNIHEYYVNIIRKYLNKLNHKYSQSKTGSKHIKRMLKVTVTIKYHINKTISNVIKLCISYIYIHNTPGGRVPEILLEVLD